MNTFTPPRYVVSRTGKQTGEVRGTRSCQLEGCRGLCLIVKWDDGKRTHPCTKGMTELTPERWQIA